MKPRDASGSQNAIALCLSMLYLHFIVGGYRLFSLSHLSIFYYLSWKTLPLFVWTGIKWDFSVAPTSDWMSHRLYHVLFVRGHSAGPATPRGKDDQGHGYQEVGTSGTTSFQHEGFPLVFPKLSLKQLCCSILIMKPPPTTTYEGPTMCQDRVNSLSSILLP